MLTKNQAESASDLLLAEKRKEQKEYANTIATKYRPFSTWLRFTVAAITGLCMGAILGSSRPNEFILWCAAGLISGIVYALCLGQMRRKREA